MKRHKGFWNRFRGVSDDVVNMIATLKLSIESAEETRDLYEKYINLSHAKKDYLKCVHGDIYKCQRDLDNYIDIQIKEHPSYRGKIECLLDFEKNGQQWIYNEVVTGTIWERYRNCEYNVEIILSYIKMTEYITGKKLMDKYIKPQIRKTNDKRTS